MTRVASAATEEFLLSIAVHGTAQHVERVVQHFRRAKEAEELSREARQHAGRSLSWHYDEDGSLIVKARLPAEAGALLLKALDAGVDAISAPHVPAGTLDAPTRSAQRADALAVLALTAWWLREPRARRRWPAYTPLAELLLSALTSEVNPRLHAVAHLAVVRHAVERA